MSAINRDLHKALCLAVDALSLVRPLKMRQELSDAVDAAIKAGHAALDAAEGVVRPSSEAVRPCSKTLQMFQEETADA